MASDPSHLLKIKQASIKMMAIRGYNLSEEDHSIMNYRDGKQLLIHADYFIHKSMTPLRKFMRNSQIKQTGLRNMLSSVYEKPVLNASGKPIMDRDGSPMVDRCIVFFVETPEGKRLVMEGISTMAKMLLQEPFPAKRGIIISYEEMAPIAASEIRTVEMDNPNYYIQHFQDCELFYDPLDHVYSATKWKKLTQYDIESLVEEGVEVTSFPRTLSTDAFIKRIGCVPGDVVRLECPTLVPGTLLQSEIVYKLVIAPPTDKRSRK